MKKLAFLAIAITILTASSAAFAGYKWSLPVSISTWSGTSFASGMIGTARNSGDSAQFIGCELYANSTYSVASCFARDAAGTQLNCYTRLDERMKQVVSGITDGSYVSFQTSSVDPTKCSFIHVKTSSENELPAQ